MLSLKFCFKFVTHLIGTNNYSVFSLANVEGLWFGMNYMIMMKYTFDQGENFLPLHILPP